MRARGEPVRRKMRSGRANRVKAVPNAETVWPVKKSQ